MKTKSALLCSVVLLVLAVKAQYTPTLGLLASYPFSGNANDNSGNENHGTVHGATLTTDRFNNQNSAYSFDGVNDYISILDNATNLRPKNLTISSWVLFNTNPNTAYKSILAKNILGNSYFESVYMGYSKDNNYNIGWLCCIGSPIGNGPFLNPLSNFSTGVWYNIVFQFDDVNNVQKLFINGAFSTSQTVSMSIGYDSDMWTIGTGREYGVLSYYWNGKIDDIAIWDRILSNDEISSIYIGCQTQTPLLVVSPNQTVNISSTTQFSVISTNTNVTYQWQEAKILDTSFSVLTDSFPYSGVTTSVLTIANVTQTHNNAMYRCAVADDCGFHYMSNTSMLTVKNITGINENDDENILSVFPNPVNRFMTIKVDSKLVGSDYKITNITGKVILSDKILYEEFQLNFSELAEGVYVLSINGLSEKKIIKVE